MERPYGPGRVVGLILLMAVGIILVCQSADAEPTAWRVGDVFIAVGDGSYQVFDHQGKLKQILHDEQGGYTTDCAFNPALDRLYTANFTRTKVVVFDADDHKVTETIDAGNISPNGHSRALVFDTEGHFYVGHPDGNALVHKYSGAGQLVETFQIATEHRGTSGLDLAVDQQTLFYTSQGRLILRFDVARGEQLADFAELPGPGHAQALRLLPPGDGAGGLLVADGENIKRLDSAGRVVQTYDAEDQDDFFALNLDPDGRSFWAANSETDALYRFDLNSGEIRNHFAAGAGNTVFGVCVKGELTAALPQAARALPTDFGVEQNTPNPFNPTTQVSYSLPQAGKASLVIYNLLGQQVRTLVSGVYEAGMYQVTWDGRDAGGREVAGGVYLYRFESGNTSATRRMLLLK